MATRKKTEADIAVEILMKKQEPMFYQDLLAKIAKRLGVQYDEQELVEVYTRLNMDNRLEYKENGMWYFVSNRSYREEQEAK